MGKIRIKTIGEEQSKEEKERKRREKEAKKATKTPGLKGGERVVSVGPSVEELEKAQTSTEKKVQEKKEAPVKKSKEKKETKAKVKSKRYKENAAVIKKDMPYSLDKAIEALKSFKKAKFDETVELHFNLKEKGVSGQVILPHGTGKQLKIEVADPSESAKLDALIAEIEKGKINFDVLVATPSAMPRLAKVAKVLGPRGLMPNPKAGTISDKPQDTVKKLSSGQTHFKSESAAPIIHLAVGKLSFEEKELSENIKAAIKAVGETKINNVVLKSTMSPRIKLQI